MTLNIAVQMDPIARINHKGDSTFAMLLEAQKRGHRLSYYTPDKLSLRGNDVVAPVQQGSDQPLRGGCGWAAVPRSAILLPRPMNSRAIARS